MGGWWGAGALRTAWAAQGFDKAQDSGRRSSPAPSRPSTQATPYLHVRPQAQRQQDGQQPQQQQPGAPRAGGRVAVVTAAEQPASLDWGGSRGGLGGTVRGSGRGAAQGSGGRESGRGRRRRSGAGHPVRNRAERLPASLPASGVQPCRRCCAVRPPRCGAGSAPVKAAQTGRACWQRALLLYVSSVGGAAAPPHTPHRARRLLVGGGGPGRRRRAAAATVVQLYVELRLHLHLRK